MYSGLADLFDERVEDELLLHKLKVRKHLDTRVRRGRNESLVATRRSEERGARCAHTRGWEACLRRGRHARAAGAQ